MLLGLLAMDRLGGMVWESNSKDRIVLPNAASDIDLR